MLRQLADGHWSPAADDLELNEEAFNALVAVLDDRTRLLAENSRIQAQRDRIWQVVGRRRQAAAAEWLDPYADPTAQELAAILTDSDLKGQA
jgi:hypothetical protein